MSESFKKREKRVNCDERIAKFKADKDTKHFASWERETVLKGDKGPETIVKRVKVRNPSLFTGRPFEYAKYVKSLNFPFIGKVNPGECVALPVGWKDPNIGTLPTKPAAGPLSGDLAHAVATVYAEQTRTSENGKTQQKFIWLSIRKRIGGAVFPPDLKSVVTSEKYGGITNNKSDYDAAIKDLATKTPTLAGVKNAKDSVRNNWDTPVDKRAGAYYFHWLPGSTSEECYGKPKSGTEETKEKACAWEWADKKGWAGKITKAEGWHHRILALPVGGVLL